MNEIPTPVTGFITCCVQSRFRPKTMYDYPILVRNEFERQ